MVYMVWYIWYGMVWYIDVLLKIFFLTLVVDKINVSFYTCTCKVQFKLFNGWISALFSTSGL